jgi:hypothetical protein
VTKLTLNERDRWVCAVLPAILFMSGYIFLGARPLLRDVRSIRSELVREDSPAVGIARLEAARVKNVRLNTALAEEQKRANSSQEALAGQLGPSATHRPTTLAELSRLCGEYHVAWLDAIPEAASAPAIPEWGGSERWRLELRGSYEDMVSLLEFITSGKLPILPAGLEMAPAATGVKLIDWVLTVWI